MKRCDVKGCRQSKASGDERPVRRPANRSRATQARAVHYKRGKVARGRSPIDARRPAVAGGLTVASMCRLAGYALASVGVLVVCMLAYVPLARAIRVGEIVARPGIISGLGLVGVGVLLAAIGPGRPRETANEILVVKAA